MRARFYTAQKGSHAIADLINSLPLKVGDGVSPFLPLDDSYVEYEVTRGRVAVEVESLFRDIPEGEYWLGGRK